MSSLPGRILLMTGDTGRACRRMRRVREQKIQMQNVAGIEFGGTKIVCGLASPEGRILERVEMSTLSPAETLPKIESLLRAFADKHGEFGAVGIGAFGPVCVDRGSDDFGLIMATPKIAWRNCNLYQYFSTRLAVPIELDTDVTAAAFGEAKWGAAAGCHSVAYVTVGTGIGLGAIVDGSAVHGLLHPEAGHIRVPHAAGDDFPGSCPYHGDCVEGMAAGPAIEQRWGKPLSEFPTGHDAYTQTAHYLSHLLVNTILFLSPQRIVVGGGVMTDEKLFPLIRSQVQTLLNGYISIPEVESGIEGLIVPPGLGGNAGLLGACAMAIA